MTRHEEIQNAYRSPAARHFYDGMITCSTLPAGRCAAWFGLGAEEMPGILSVRSPASRRGSPGNCWRCRWVPVS